MNRRRNVFMLIFLTLLVAVALGAWWAASRIQSPAEAAARTAPPTPSLIFADVEERELSSTIVTRGTGRYGLPQPISLAPSTLKPKAGMLTTLPLVNTTVEEGAVLLTASGRPVLVLAGTVPAFRDLAPSVSGDDVRQLEEGLSRLQFDPGEVDGVYDERTSAAVAQWYRSGGWEPFGPTPTQLANLRTLEQDFATATKNQLAADAAAAAAAMAVESARINAEIANQTASADVEAKVNARDNAIAGLASAERALEAARATAEHNLQAAVADLAARNADRKRLMVESNAVPPLAVESAEARAEHANKAAYADIAAKIADRAVVVLDPLSTRAARAAADAQLELARASAYRTRLEGEVTVQTARRDVTLAAGQIERAEAAVKAAKLEGEVAVQAAVDAQKLAERDRHLADVQLALAQTAQRARELEGKITVQAAVDAKRLADFDADLAQKQVERLSADLSLTRAKIGVQVPVDEIVFLPFLPVRVQEIMVTVGKEATGPLMAVTDFQLSVDVFLALDHASYVQEGMPVQIDDDLGIEAKGFVKMVAKEPGTRGADGYHRYAEIEVTELPPGTTLSGKSLRLTIPYESTDGAVTAVPIGAVMQTADGTSRVQVKKDNSELEYVDVEEGLAAQGFVAVTPIDGTLEVGQQVVIGYERSAEELFSDLGF